MALSVNLSSVLTSIKGVFGVSKAVIAQADQYIQNYETGMTLIATGAPSAVAQGNAMISQALAGLNAMASELPSAAAPYLAQLNSAMAAANPVIATTALTGIQSAL